MAKKNYDKRMKDRWRRKLEKDKMERKARFEKMYGYESIRIIRR